MMKELKEGTWLLALSGGPDSMALFDMLEKEKVSFSLCFCELPRQRTGGRGRGLRETTV